MRIGKFRRVTPQFADSTRGARKILAIEIAGLGDLVHSLPALWAVRQTYPDAELHCLVRQGTASLLRMVPWIDKVLPYERGTAPGLAYQLKFARALRLQRYDIAIDFVGADYSCAAARIAGARRRLFRYPGRSKPRHAWRWFFTDLMACSFRHEPMYLQRLNCVQQAGCARPAALFNLSPPLDPPADLDESAGPYIHMSPCAKLARKELPPAQLAEAIGRLMRDLPQHRWVLSCSAVPREREVMRELLAALPRPPAKVFDGTLDIPALYSVIAGAALHLGGDSGAMHLAWLAQTPTVSWFRDSAGFNEWIPQGPQHAVVRSADPRTDQLYGIDTGHLLARAAELIARDSAL